jgi:hypothetical protein
MEKNLPEDIKKALTNPENFRKVCEIVKKFGLGPDEINNIFDSVYLKIMEGELPPSQAIKAIEENSKISHELSQEIWENINNEILIKYNESLKKIYPQDEFKAEQPKFKKELGLGPEEKTKFAPPLPLEKEENKNEGDFDDILKKLSLELEKEKEKRKEIDEKLKEHIPQKITPKERGTTNDFYREKIDDEEEVKPNLIKGEDGKTKKIL